MRIQSLLFNAATFYSLYLFAVHITGASGAAIGDVSSDVLRCANGKDVCPSGYTCCGPLRPGIGGV
ncbi:hypothetical protein CC1G_02414 [Coprinopsis cinerea okayama7|uniref:Hydrophobin n=1 Tax=Coprinopsis cinerea (strain Okayama-7 / 130 / ATCC MYA-4618 / FGSC 9003) TaxID=240176 RepID=A8NBF4_COPC7|nr:hypothetical protein CC1G_02414 [Coprinopsis cinerea okayama7\|eukprot:XP_001832152.2 hypothetical protein CC1G_02414 [Coprinopsis cinerea okayama7\